jgi:Arc/MetJ-type ribon-helix-helix transcriptional regulator
MAVILPEELEHRVETEMAFGDFPNSDQLVVAAVREFLQKRESLRRRKSLDELSDAVDAAGLYYKVYVPPDVDD